jgi:preprotein translocase subunit SecE
MIGRIREFFRSVASEFKKVTWPSREEATGSTVVVIVAIVIVAVGLGVIDWIIGKTVGQVLR